MAIGNHEETCLFFVTNLLGSTPIILGLPWLRRHQPSTDWFTISFTSEYCQTSCCPPWLDPTAPTCDAASQGPSPLPLQTTRTTSSTHVSPYAEDAPEEEENLSSTAISPCLTSEPHPSSRPITTVEEPEVTATQPCANDSPELPIPSTLSPGTHPFRTRVSGTATHETRALMIPNTPLHTRPAPAAVVAGRRRCGKPLQKE